MAAEEFVQGDTEGVEVGAIVDRAVHASGLFWGKVGEGAFELFGVEGVGGFGGDAGGEGEVAEFGEVGVGVVYDVGGFDVFVGDVVGL